MKISQRGIDFIKESEKFEPKEYTCPGGKQTIGYGHVLYKGENYDHLPYGISKELAERFLINDIKEVQTTINKWVKVKLTQGQYDALVSLVYNWGSNNFITSKGLTKLNEGDYQGAIKEFSDVIRSNGKILPGLIIRRAKEAEMWKSEDVEIYIDETVKPDIKNNKNYKLLSMISIICIIILILFCFWFIIK